MKVVEIDKAVYRKRLNIVIAGFILCLAALSIGISSILISLFSEQGVNLSLVSTEQVEQGSNFKYNFLGVVLALLACAAILNSVKRSQFFDEIYYVWRLKQIHNSIYRKLKKIKQAAYEQNDINAVIILLYYFTTLKQVYLLDDNTLTMANVTTEQQKLQTFIEEKHLTVSIEQFDKSLLDAFK